MSDHLTVTQLRSTAQETQKWLDELAQNEPFENEDQAYSMLRAVLHAVRDRLTVEEVTHLGSQLPMLVRGFYFEGWRPALAPNDFDTEAGFLERVNESLGGELLSPTIDLRAATMKVIAFLDDKVDEGQMRHVRDQLPQEIQEFFLAATES